MEDQCSPLSWGCYYQEEGIEELRHNVLYTTLELETTILQAKEEITKREYELIHLKDLLSKTMKERDEAKTQCQKLMLDKLMLQQQLQPKQQQQYQQHQQETVQLSGSPTSSEDESKVSDSKKHFSSSDSKKNIIASLGSNSIPQQPLPPPLPPQQPLPPAALKLAATRALPEKGKLLQAVKEAGPLLKNLLLAGPLPQWQHPPPQLDSIEIPPVTISSPPPRLLHQDSFNSLSILSKKRAIEFCEGFDSSPNIKYQKFIHH